MDVWRMGLGGAYESYVLFVVWRSVTSSIAWVSGSLYDLQRKLAIV